MRVSAREPGPGGGGVVERGDGTTGEHQATLCWRSGRRRNSSEPRQDADGPALVVVGRLEIDLHDLAAGALARVADLHRAGEVFARGDRQGFHAERVVRPVRVAQAMAEGEMSLGTRPVVTPVTDPQALAVDEIGGIPTGAEGPRIHLLA